ncbi:MAG: ABC transporter permease [Patescibacteria group bacterium]
MYKFFENIKLAVKAIWSKKIRSFLTMLGVIIGVFSIVLLIGIGEGVKSEVTSQVEGLGSNIIMILPGSGGMSGASMMAGGSFSTEDVETIETVENIEYVIPMAIVPLPVALTAPVAPSAQAGSAEVPDTSSDLADLMAQAQQQVMAIGSTQQLKAAFEGSEISSGKSYGRMFTEEEYDSAARVVSLQYGAVAQLFPQESAENVIGRTIYIGKEAFEVVGAQEVKETNSIMEDPTMTNMIFLPITAAQELTGELSITQIVVTVTEPDYVSTVQDNIRLALLESHDGVEDFTITNQEEILSMFDQILSVLTTMLGGIAAISLLVGGIGVMNIMLVSVTERTKEIGLRKAIGASGADILVQFLVEAVFLTFLGGAIGIGLAYVGGSIMDAQWGLTAKITVQSVLLAFSFTTLIGIFFGVAPAIRAARLDPIDALKYE